jgi:hypothetical protein
MKIHRSLSIALTILALAFAALACTINIGGPDYPQEPVPVSTEAVTALKDQIKAAVELGKQTGQITLQISEPQLTSLFAFRLNENEEPFITDPQVYLRDGQIQVYGKARQGNFEANVRIVLDASVDENGQATLSISSVDFGPLEAPAGLNEGLTAILQEAFTGSLGPVATGFRLETIEIADGVMTLSGRVK